MPPLRLPLACLLALVGALLAAPGALAGTTTVNAAGDSWVTSRYPNKTHGDQSVLRVKQSPVKRAYVRFSVGALDGSVESAVLRFYSRTAAPDGLRVYASSPNWGERTLTYANAPALGSLVATVGPFSRTGSWHSVDVTSAVTGGGARSFVVTTPGSRGEVYLTSKEGGRTPQLVVTTSDPNPDPDPEPEPVPPANTALPTVSGTARQGQTLTAARGTWTGTAPLSYAYQWLRCDVAGANCEAVTDGTGTSRELSAADVGKTMRVRVTATNAGGQASAESVQTAVVATELPGGTTPGTVITTDRSWECRGALTAFGKLPIKIVSDMPNPGDRDAIRLVGCYGDGDPATVDLILDVRGNGRDRGTAYDAIRIGQDAHDLVVTGNVECGARHTDPNIHQDVVQALSGNRIEFRDFTSGDPETGRWTCWGAGGGWYVTWANGGIPTDLVCVRCKLATYNQNLRIDESVRSGARDSVFGYSRSYGIFIGPAAINPVNVDNRVIRY